MEWYLKVLKNYAAFDGRARRKEFWMFGLIQVSIVLVFMIAAALMSSGSGEPSPVGIVLVVLVMLYLLATAIPGLAVTVRRLHDVGKSGWWVLAPAIPIIGFIFSIYLLVKYCTDGNPEDNQYGPNPKIAEGAAN